MPRTLNNYKRVIKLITQLVTVSSELRDIVPAWDKLSCQAIEPNVFYESWSLLPALERLVPATNKVAVLLIWQDKSHTILTGFFPLLQESTFRKCPACHWRNWLHLHCPLGTPLLHKDYAQATLTALFDWLHEHSNATVFSLNKIPQEGDFLKQLRVYAYTQGHLLDEQDTWERALIQATCSGEDYVSKHQSKKRLKEYSRLRRRLEEKGDLEFHTLLPGNYSHLTHWIDEFLQLEQRGWKGRADTAMSCNHNEHLFAKSLLLNAAQRNQLMMLKMTFNGEVVAIKLNLLNVTDGAYALKIAYHEDYASYSPGVLLELENIYTLLDNTSVTWMDSCAVPNHSMIDRLWNERRTMVNLHISTHKPLSKTLMHTMRLLKNAYSYYRSY